jgi:hypothetical protein
LNLTGASAWLTLLKNATVAKIARTDTIDSDFILVGIVLK